MKVLLLSIKVKLDLLSSNADNKWVLLYCSFVKTYCIVLLPIQKPSGEI